MDQVEDTIDEVREQMEEMQEIQDAMGQDLSGGMFDEDELESELAELEEEALDEALLDISVGIVHPPGSRSQRLREWRGPTCPSD